MKKKIFGALITAGLTLMIGSSAAAAGWQLDATGWWWLNDNGTWPSNSWQWLDGNFDGVAECYYFGPDGYMYTSGVTPDGYTVNADGAWVVNGVVQTKIVPIQGFYSDDDTYNTDGYVYAEEYEYQYGYRDEPQYEYQVPDHTEEKQEADPEEYAYQVYELVNEEREKEGLDPLNWDEGLAACAAMRAEEIVEEFAHTRGGAHWSTILEENGIDEGRGVGENIAMGYSDPEAVMKGWMNSSGHRANILRRNYGSIGVGCFINNGTCYWVQNFRLD